MDLKYVYPPQLQEAILWNWLCNPKGTPNGFRGMDWLQELNNLYTKACSNLTGFSECHGNQDLGHLRWSRSQPYKRLGVQALNPS